jgi:GntR family transcriptional regulator
MTEQAGLSHGPAPGRACQRRTGQSSSVGATPAVLSATPSCGRGGFELSDVPVYLQLAAILRGEIERGELVPRRPVPSKRQLTQEYGIAGGTVDKALAVLRGEKLVKTVRGRGIYVTAPEERLQPAGRLADGRGVSADKAADLRRPS